MLIDPEEVEEIFEEAESMLGDAHFYIDLGKRLILLGKPALTEALKTLVATYTDVRRELECELAAASLVGAKAFYRDYRNYVDAGFTDEQAFALVLAAVKPIDFSTTLSQASRSTSYSYKNL